MFAELYSDSFSTGGYKWRILIFPKGYNVDYLSIYLKVPDLATLPKGWSRDAQFSFSVINQIDSKNTIKIDTQHVFNASKSVRGFKSFILHSELSSAKGFILKDTCIIEAEVRLKRNEEDAARSILSKRRNNLRIPSHPIHETKLQMCTGSEHCLISVNVPLPLEQSIPSAKIKEQSEQEPVLEKTRVRTQAEDDPFRNNENPITRSTVLESEEVSTLKEKDTQEETKMVVTGQSLPLVNQSSAEPPGEPTVVEAGERSSSFAEFDKLFTDIQNLLGGESSKAENFSSLLPPSCSVEEIASVIQLDKAPVLKNSLSIMLTTGRFPSNMVDRTTKFLADIDESCETYESAKQDISVAQEDEKRMKRE
ncbi:uncharacterized protein LOC21395778 [Morus notabilis]|uniref:uncharacterized protein LOC21395778 n=1 Tax=Morus notabilis TaxID=981085 RepID=UPI000CECED9E|nr:uncharacterized protein LOC21395778 [Morus notabilis]